MAIEPGDVVIAGTSVGTHTPVVDVGVNARVRGATLIVLTNVAFELDARTELTHPSQKRLHELADVLVDLKGPLGDGVADFLETGVRILPHSGITGTVAAWMIFAEAYVRLLERGKLPLMWQCMMVRGARSRNDALLEEYYRTHRGYQLIRSQPESKSVVG